MQRFRMVYLEISHATSQLYFLGVHTILLNLYLYIYFFLTKSYKVQRQRSEDDKRRAHDGKDGFGLG